jgi:hypothetical protein
MRAVIILGFGALLLTIALHSPGPGTLSRTPAISVAARSPKDARSAGRALDQTGALDAALLDAIDVETNLDRRSEALDRAANSVRDPDLLLALSLLAKHGGPASTELTLILLRRWAENSPTAAAAWVSQSTESPLALEELQEVTSAWAAADLATAGAYVNAMPMGASKETATLALAYEAARTRPLAALELASQLTASPERDALLTHAVSQWAGADGDAAAGWAIKVPDHILQQRLLSAVAVASAENDPAMAARLVATAMDPGDEQNRTAVSIIQRWAQHSPQGAAAWVMQFPEGPSRDSALENLLAAWVQQDASGASTWVRGLPDGSLHAVAANAYLRAVSDSGRNALTVVPAGEP